MRRLTKMLVAGAALGVGTAAWFGPRYLRAASLLSASAGIEDPTGITERVRGEITTRRFEVPTASAPMLVAEYAPAGDSPRFPVLLVHGIHPAGIDEPRLSGFARAFAEIGHPVWTPQVPELAALDATSDTVSRLHAVGEQLVERYGQPALGFGVSVGGGLTLLAATRPSAQPVFKRVVTLGAHHDLVRVAQHYAGKVATDPEGHATDVEPHPYGLWVLAHAHAHRLFAEGDLDAARALMHAWINEDAAGIDEARRSAGHALSVDGQRLLQDLRRAPIGPTLQRRMLDAIDDARSELREVSPSGHMARMQAEVMLLHGADDPVVPPTEMAWITADLPKSSRGGALITPVLGHAEFPEGMPIKEHVTLLHFVARMLR